MSRLPTTIKVGDVVIDENIYPRDHVQTSHVTRLMEAINAGTELPALTVEKKTKRSIDGTHSTLAFRKLFGPDYAALVEWVGPFATNDDAMEEAARRNVHHGLPLSESDRARTVFRLRQGGVDRQTIANVLQISETRVQKLETRIAFTVPIQTPSAQTTLIFGNGVDQTESGPEDGDENEPEDITEIEEAINSDREQQEAKDPHREAAAFTTNSSVVIPLKPDTRHWGGVMVEDQRKVDALRGSPGSGYKTVITELIRALRTEILNREDVGLMGMLEDLRNALTNYLD